MKSTTHTNMFKEFVSTSLNFVQTGTVEPDLLEAEKLVGSRELRVLVIKLMSWLKSYSKFNKMSVLKLKGNIPWENNVQELINKNSFFSANLEIGDSYISIHSSVTEQEIADALKLVSENYSPPKFVTKR